MLHQKIIFNLPKIVIFIEFRGFIVFLTTDVCVDKIMCELEKAWLIVLLLKKKKKAEALVSVLYKINLKHNFHTATIVLMQKSKT